MECNDTKASNQTDFSQQSVGGTEVADPDRVADPDLCDAEWHLCGLGRLVHLLGCPVGNGGAGAFAGGYRQGRRPVAVLDHRGAVDRVWLALCLH